MKEKKRLLDFVDWISKVSVRFYRQATEKNLPSHETRFVPGSGDATGQNVSLNAEVFGQPAST